MMATIDVLTSRVNLITICNRGVPTPSRIGRAQSMVGGVSEVGVKLLRVDIHHGGPVMVVSVLRVGLVGVIVTHVGFFSHHAFVVVVGDTSSSY
jgi:hypothetical protein